MVGQNTLQRVAIAGGRMKQLETTDKLTHADHGRLGKASRCETRHPHVLWSILTPGCPARSDPSLVFPFRDNGTIMSCDEQIATRFALPVPSILTSHPLWLSIVTCI